MIINSDTYKNFNMNELRLSYADELVNDMYKEYNKYCKLLELAKKDRIEVIKDVIRYTWCNEKILMNAQSWLRMKETVDNRKKYEEKEDFEYLLNNMKDIFNDTIEIKTIMFEGYERYACMIDFVCDKKDCVYELTIPMMNEFCEKWWNQMHGGKLSLHYYKREGVLDYLCESYKEEEIKKKLNDFSMFETKDVISSNL